MKISIQNLIVFLSVFLINALVIYNEYYCYNLCCKIVLVQYNSFIYIFYSWGILSCRPLASYNSLQDKNLVGYFSTTKMKKHLKRSGLVSMQIKYWCRIKWWPSDALVSFEPICWLWPFWDNPGDHCAQLKRSRHNSGFSKESTITMSLLTNWDHCTHAVSPIINLEWDYM